MDDYNGKRLFRCHNPKCSEHPAGVPGHDFWAAPDAKGRVSCPKCGTASDAPRTGRLIVPVTVIHYEPPSEVEGIGAGHLACERGKPPLKGAMRTGEASAVNCPYCRSTAAWADAVKASNVDPAFDVPVTINAAKEAYELQAKA